MTIKTASANLTTTSTTVIYGKAILLTLKKGLANLVATSSINCLGQYVRGTQITLSTATTAAGYNQTITLTSANGLTTLTATGCTYPINATTITLENIGNQSIVGYTVTGSGIASATTVSVFTPLYIESFQSNQNFPQFSLNVGTIFKIVVDIEALGLPLVESSNYTFEFSEGFFITKTKATADGISNENEIVQSAANTISYTTNAPLGIASSSPTAGQSGTLVNDYIRLVFNRKITRYIGYYIRLYKADGTLLKTFDITSNGVVDQKTITLDVRGIMQADTNYYLISDSELFKDADNFIFNGFLNTSAFAFSTAAQPLFKDLISLQQSSGTIVINNARTRNFGKALESTSSLSTTAGRRRTGQVAMTVFTRVGPYVDFASNIYWGNDWPTFPNSFFLYPIVGKIHSTAVANITARATLTAQVTRAQFFAAGRQSTFSLTTTGLRIQPLASAMSTAVSTSVIGSKMKFGQANFVSTITVSCDAVKTQRAFLSSSSSITINPVRTAGGFATITAASSIRVRVLVSFASGREFTIDTSAYPSSIDANYIVGPTIAPHSHNPFAANTWTNTGDISSSPVYVYNISDGSLHHTFTQASASDAFNGVGFGEGTTVSPSYIAISLSETSTDSLPRTWIYDKTSKASVRVLEGGGQRLYIQEGSPNKLTVVNKYLSSTRSRGIKCFNMTTGAVIQNITDTELGETLFTGNAARFDKGFDQYENYVAVAGARYANNVTGGVNHFGQVHIFDFSNSFASKSYTISNPLPPVSSSSAVAGDYDDSLGTGYGTEVRIDANYVYIHGQVFAGGGGGSGGYGRGKIYIHNRSNGSLVTTISDPETRTGTYPSGGSYYTEFGQVMKLTDTYLIVRSNYYSGDTSNTNNIKTRWYVYNKSNWSLAYFTEYTNTTAGFATSSVTNNSWFVTKGPASAEWSLFRIT